MACVEGIDVIEIEVAIEGVEDVEGLRRTEIMVLLGQNDGHRAATQKEGQKETFHETVGKRDAKIKNGRTQGEV